MVEPALVSHFHFHDFDVSILPFAMTLADQILDFGKRARAAARILARSTPEQKNAALVAMADEIVAAAGEILSENSKDVERAKANGLSGAMIDRLTLTPKRLEGM